MRSTRTNLLALAALFSTTAEAGVANLRVHVEALAPGDRLPAWSAFCARPGAKRYDISPAISWTKGPRGTRSYAVLMTDPDVPADLTLIGRPEVTIQANAPRQRVFHWVLVDIPPRMTSIARGSEGASFTAHGKPIGRVAAGVRGANVYTSFFEKLASMAGTYGGYDGPCPPPNDALTHRYAFSVFALDTPTLGLEGAFDGETAEKAMRGHVLASGAVALRYDRKAEAQ